INDQTTHSRNGVPFLMDIPVLGWAFRVNSDTANRTELLVLISPYVVQNREDARMVTDEFSSRLEGLKRMAQVIRERHARYKRDHVPNGRGDGGDVVPRESAP